MRKKNKWIFQLFLALVCPVWIWAQQTLVHQDPFSAYQQAKQWFHQEQYHLAHPVFLNTTPLVANAAGQQLRADELMFYSIATALMQSSAQAEQSAKSYLASNASATYKGQLGYYLGVYFFKQNQYNQAIAAFEQAVPDNLSNRQISEMQFCLGYAYFTQKRFNDAKPLLQSVKALTESKYYTKANYYYGLIAFNEKKYREALDALDVAEKDPEYASVLPYYNASINYTIGQKDEALAKAEKALQEGNQFYAVPLQQLVGHAYFERGNYAKALPFLERYVAGADKVKREDLYELGYSYYQQGQWRKAIDQLKPLSGGQDSLSQSAMYVLGDAYLKTGDKANARNAFLFCSKNSSNSAAKETSAFLYGKLSYELGYDNEALNTLKNFGVTYPSSKYITEAKVILVSVLSNTSNYAEALALYEALPAKTEGMQQEYPKILFNRAQQLINDKQLAAAEPLLDKALQAPYNKAIKPLAQFWKGELAYEKEDFAEAENYYRQFLTNAIRQGEVSAENARYNLAYALLRQARYDDAQKEFLTLSKQKFAAVQQEQDVTARLADTYYMQKAFTSAKPLYAKIQAMNGFDADYATFQNGLIAGALNNTAEKVATLRGIEAAYPNSILVQPANMEIANTFLADEKFKEAIPYLTKVASNKKNSSLKPEAFLKLGIANYNIDNNTEALAQFKTLLKEYPQSAESEDAIDNVRSIFIEQGKPSDFLRFMNDLGRTVNVAQADSLTYTAAELQLSEGKKEAALVALQQYLATYNNGRYAVQAAYQVAELLAAKKDYTNAAANYRLVVDKAPNKYAEKANLLLARIYYFELKDLAAAATFYQQLKDMATTQDNKLEAMRGLLRCQFYTKQYGIAVANAKDLLEQRGAGSDDKTFANLVLGKNAQEQGNFSEAIGNYKVVASINRAEYGAEARYEMAKCFWQLKNYTEAEKVAFEVIKKSSSYEEWVTRSYILLGDIYFAQKDYFNAKATYKSVSENAGSKALRQEAAEKLAKAEAEEKAKMKIEG
ncbi:MAG: hypothetical protein EAY75_08730 [Bacteroidetes bacterium]|nr:MAG: hypothetical protein EAY75_08730 [Bacteroidota bacterium]